LKESKGRASVDTEFQKHMTEWELERVQLLEQIRTDSELHKTKEQESQRLIVDLQAERKKLMDYDRTNSSASSGGSSAVHSCPTLTSIQVSPNPPSEALFNVRTLMRIGQQACLARTLETLTIDVCCIQETRIQDSSSTIRLTSPSNPSVKFHLRLSGDP
uniref:Kinesin motor domain-containing protein n=1 Tax=Echinostoma caproni TaxID=27848 RepID=A0A183BEW0_9TREM